MVTVTLVLIVAAVVLAGLAVFRSRGTSETAWACLCLSVALLLPRLG